MEGSYFEGRGGAGSPPVGEQGARGRRFRSFFSLLTFGFKAPAKSKILAVFNCWQVRIPLQLIQLSLQHSCLLPSFNNVFIEAVILYHIERLQICFILYKNFFL
ncbi:hypothetical protein [Fischerella thermalis]|uniref:hypothetical protein n=1 Tax=Fischerella thermalis TaxID=372787 RepID=UPI00241FEE14|nr:hypothetical protein [Fischerella thermalis]